MNSLNEMKVYIFQDIQSIFVIFTIYLHYYSIIFSFIFVTSLEVWHLLRLFPIILYHFWNHTIFKADHQRLLDKCVNHFKISQKIEKVCCCRSMPHDLQNKGRSFLTLENVTTCIVICFIYLFACLLQTQFAQLFDFTNFGIKQATQRHIR